MSEPYTDGKGLFIGDGVCMKCYTKDHELDVLKQKLHDMAEFCYTTYTYGAQTNNNISDNDARTIGECLFEDKIAAIIEAG